MGGSVSAGHTNDELVDNLVESGHIKTENVERVFRTVDRGLFYLPNHKDVAYRDLAWREGNIHISAPCIYSEVMEALEIKEGCSFLNVGSGTGYLSTMVGLLLGPYGVNHNIELHGDVIDYAKQRITDFGKTSVYFDDFNFCRPKFVHGNCLSLCVNEEDTQTYDRIYVGAGVNNEHEEYFKSLLKVNGILVLPLDDKLVQIKRKSKDEYSHHTIMAVSFASLIQNDVLKNSIKLPKANPLTLKELCRFKIREVLRSKIEVEHPEYYKFIKKKRGKTANSRSKPTTAGGQRHFYRGNSQITEGQFRLIINGRIFGRRVNNETEADGSDDSDFDDDEIVIEDIRPIVDTEDGPITDNAASVEQMETIENEEAVNATTSRSDVIPIHTSRKQTNDSSSSINESGYGGSVSTTTSTNRSSFNSTNGETIPNTVDDSEQTNRIRNDKLNDNDDDAFITHNDQTNANHNDNIKQERTNYLRNKVLSLPTYNVLKAYILYNRHI